MKWALGTILILGVLMSVGASAQMEMPKPAPELKKLDYFLGTWKMEGDMKPSPMGPGGKFMGTEHNEWMEGNFFVVIHSEFNSKMMGNGKGVSYMGYNADEKKYTYNEFNSMGENSMSSGTLDGDTWTWLGEEKMGGQTIRGRFTMKQTSPTSYDFKYEMAPPGQDFALVMDGKSTKQ